MWQKPKLPPPPCHDSSKCCLLNNTKTLSSTCQRGFGRDKDHQDNEICAVLYYTQTNIVNLKQLNRSLSFSLIVVNQTMFHCLRKQRRQTLWMLCVSKDSPQWKTFSKGGLFITHSSTNMENLELTECSVSTKEPHFLNLQTCIFKLACIVSSSGKVCILGVTKQEHFTFLCFRARDCIFLVEV